jgi:hypothetical protein
LAVAGGDENQRAAGDIGRVLGFESFAQVGGHAHEVFHHCGWILKNPAIYFLMNVADPRAALVVGGGVSFVDVTDLEGFGVLNLAVDLKLFGNLLKMFFGVRHSIGSHFQGRRRNEQWELIQGSEKAKSRNKSMFRLF